MTKLRVFEKDRSGSEQGCEESSADEKDERTGTGDDMKNVTSDPVLRRDGGDVKVAQHRPPGEDIVRPKQQLNRNNHPSDPVCGSDQVWHAFTGEETQTPKHSSRPDSFAAVISAASSSKRRSNCVQKAQAMEDGNSLRSYGEVLIGPKKNGHGGSNSLRAGEVFADAGRGENTLMADNRESKILDPPCFEDVSANKVDGDEPANKIDPLPNIGGGQPMDQSSTPVNLIRRKLEEEEARRKLEEEEAGEASFSETTSVWTGEKRAKITTSAPTSWENLNKITHGDDEHSRKVAQVVLEEQNDVDDDETHHYYIQLKNPHKTEDFWAQYDDPQQVTEVHERLALYRIKAYELCNTGKESDITQLKRDFPPDVLHKEGYFKHYEERFEWYFNPEYCIRSGFDDYQRLVLGYDFNYKSWEDYIQIGSTRKADLEYLQFYEELLSKVKSIEDPLISDKDKYSATQRVKFYNRAFSEGPKIAARFPNICENLVSCAVLDCTWSLMFDLLYHEDLDGVFFEIWKRVAKQKMDFTDALRDVIEQDLYPLRHRIIEDELQNRKLRPIKLKNGYDTYVAHIGPEVPESEARLLIKETIKKMVPKQAALVDYIRRKLEVAREIGVITT